MSKIRSKNNRSTERAFMALLRREGLTGWRRHCDLPGRPDFAFPKFRVAVFIDGCFWHQCSKCYDGHVPKQNRNYWIPKLARNKRRDQRNTRLLRKAGWRVFRFRECSIAKSNSRLPGSMGKLRRAAGDKGV